MFTRDSLNKTKLLKQLWRLLRELPRQIKRFVQLHWQKIAKALLRQMFFSFCLSNYFADSFWAEIWMLMKDVKVIADYFKSVILEFWQLKKLVKATYHHFMHSSSLWEVVFQQQDEAYPNIFLIIEILLVISFSSSKNFSFSWW